MSGLPSGYVANQASSPAYSSPINTTVGDTNYNSNKIGVTMLGATTPTVLDYAPGPNGSNAHSNTILNGPINYNVDPSVFKVFPIKENTALRFNIGAFNALNIMGYNNPDTTTGEIRYQSGAVGAASYWTPRQIQLTLRLQF